MRLINRCARSGSRVAALLVGGVVALVSAQGRASAATLTFEGIGGGGCQVAFTTYSGFNWSSQDPDSWATECDADYMGASPGYENSVGAPSATHAAGNGAGTLWVALATDPGSTFDFLGAMVTGWAFQDQLDGGSSTELLLEGYLGNQLMGSLFQDLTATYAALDMGNVVGGLNGIDYLLFWATGSEKSWLLDDMEVVVHGPEPPEIPEPASLVLFGTGLAVVAARLRRRSAVLRG